jgi:hypothetical protein
MDARSLTSEQRGAIRRQALGHLEYLGKLVARVESLAWPADDPMRVEAVNARDAVEAMLAALAAAEPAAPFLAHYGPSEGEQVKRDAGGTADLPWVGKRRGSRRRR